MSLSLGHLLLVLIIVFILFGARLPNVMRDLGKGIRNLRDELNHDKDKKPESDADKPADKN